MNGRRYRASTETADKHQAQDIEARERSRILDGRHGIRRQPGVTFKDVLRSTCATTPNCTSAAPDGIARF